MSDGQSDKQDKFDELRGKAEDILSQNSDRLQEPSQDFLELLHELKVHQIELEIQNEELRSAQQELSAFYRKFADLYEFAPCGYVTLSAKGVITKINLNGTVLLGEERRQLTRMALSSFIAQDSEALYFDALKRAGVKGEKQSVELKLRLSKEERPRWVRADIQADCNESGEVTQWRVTLIDITQSKTANQDLEKALQEKNYLMKELNHRVKNNLLIISSLLSLKNANAAEDVDLSDVQHRIDAIRIVHEILYKEEDIQHIKIDEYIKQLLATIFSYFSENPVTIKRNVPSVSLSTRKAIPLGLIINEIATNAIQHGFNGNGESVFTVEMKEDTRQDRYMLTLSNNGNTFPQHIKLENAETLGLQLITAFVEQLEGTLTLERGPQTTFRILIPKQ